MMTSFISVPRSAQLRAMRTLQAKGRFSNIIMSNFKIEKDSYYYAQIISSQGYITTLQADEIIMLSKNSKDKDLLGGSEFIRYLKDNLKYR
jgi:hypothetical protein